MRTSCADSPIRASPNWSMPFRGSIPITKSTFRTVSASIRDTVWKLIEAGSVVYVCGDASGMAPGVRQAFATIHAAKTGASAQQSERWINQMTADRRYLVDVWSAT